MDRDLTHSSKLYVQQKANQNNKTASDEVVETKQEAEEATVSFTNQLVNTLRHSLRLPIVSYSEIGR